MNVFGSDEVLKNLADGVCVTNLKGEILHVNPAACSIFNNTEDQMLGKNIIVGLPVPMIPVNDELIGLLIDATVERHGTHEAVVDFDGGDGNVRTLRACILYSDNIGGCIICIFTDLTELFRVHNVFEKYMSKDVADLVLNSDAANRMGGTLQLMTALMSDIRGFTAMSETLPPDQVVKLLNHYFEAMVEIIEAHNGTLDSIMGDGMLIEFGVPKESASHADDALLCALEMQRAMDDVNKWNEEQGLPRIEMGIGIHSGQVIVGNIGSHKRAEFTCIGRPINVASRIEGHAKGGQVLISNSALKMLSKTPTIKETIIIHPKGLSRDVTVYDIADYFCFDL